jgi:hypothetical protein
MLGVMNIKEALGSPVVEDGCRAFTGRVSKSQTYFVTLSQDTSIGYVSITNALVM